MSIHVSLQHRTEYRYDRLVGLSPHVVRLRPAPHTRTRILSYSLRVDPAEHFINWQQDPFGNYLARLAFPERTRHLNVEVGLVAEMAVFNPFDFFLEPSAENFPFSYETELARDLAPYLAPSAAGPRLRALLESVPRKVERSIDFLVDLNRRLHREIRYVIRMEPGVQTVEQTLSLACGSCRDSGWVLVQCLRHLGLAARFVSGYLIQLKPDVKAIDGPSGTDHDFTDLHAWCEVYLPGAGWIGLDPTSGLFAGEGHIPLACTPEPGSAAPITGAVDECEVEFSHAMHVTRIFEAPRVTFPYTDAQWARIGELGRAVDAELRQGDVRLTMGGEPTFVADNDRDGAEWNTAALGPNKRAHAIDLAHRLFARYGPGGFLHFGQGKWYPGEPLPRWALGIYWRRDGVACWQDPTRFADERKPRRETLDDARRLIVALARRLELDPRYAIPAYEDAWYYLWRERRLPVNVDPFDSRLDDELERARLRRVFDHGLATAVGYALPLRALAAGPDGPQAQWQTGPWVLRAVRMYLVPGDSPMGWRLPLDSLPWALAGDQAQDPPRDPFDESLALPVMPSRAAVHGQRAGADVGATATRAPPARLVSSVDTTRTALCVEPRNGILHVFMPPLARLEDYLALLAAIEESVAACGTALVVEGYPPPRDARLENIHVTPDPGVIEVNVQPSSSWDELAERTEFLYEAARHAHLSAEKFMVDGRHAGTGGGNHIVLGGATPADSPLLRRPDLLASLISYWHNHPALSYLFSGLFLGPTSQAPRVDEARNDQLYELEIALAQLRRLAAPGADVRPWLVDRLLRNVLIDVTGNTHRAEFCIDKLYSPDGPTGRLGLLELRAFEMPPHARMSLVQQLLMRALVAWFWREPYRERLARWGTQLHDRFLLPTFIDLDLQDVLEQMRLHGYDFDDAWFAPHTSFRFPHYGEVAARGIGLHLRGALEPWHVMGEEGASGATARYVDSSLERLEVRVTGLNDARHVITVNGRALPLQPTGRAGEYVAGVRYRAWLPPSALHPTIGIHAPLTFDIVDTWMRCSLGGCTYHVAHPGGLSYQTFPVNAFEAESRRLARFFRIGHTPGEIDVTPASPSPEFPCTLDLRR